MTCMMPKERCLIFYLLKISKFIETNLPSELCVPSYGGSKKVVRRPRRVKDFYAGMVMQAGVSARFLEGMG